MSDAKFLVVVRADPGSAHESYTAAIGEHPYDYAVVTTSGESPLPAAMSAGARFTHHTTGASWTALLQALDVYREIVAEYDYLWLSDATMTAEPEAVTELFSIAEALRVDVAHPALIPGSSFTQPAMLVHRNFQVRFPDAMEIAAPVISREFLDRHRPLLGVAPTAGGLEAVLPDVVPVGKLAIIDSAPMLRTAPPNEEREQYARDRRATLVSRNLVRTSELSLSLGGITRSGAIVAFGSSQADPEVFQTLYQILGFLPQLASAADLEQLGARLARRELTHEDREALRVVSYVETAQSFMEGLLPLRVDTDAIYASIASALSTAGIPVSPAPDRPTRSGPAPVEPHRLTFVVARYREDVGWVDTLPPDAAVYLYNKGPALDPARFSHPGLRIVPLPNYGRESQTYLHHLRTHDMAADGADNFTVFTQGDPLEHAPEFFRLLEETDRWHDIQPLASRWLVQESIPPPRLIAADKRHWTNGIPLRPEYFNLYTWEQLHFHDDGILTLDRTYRELRQLPPGMSIARDFLELCGLDELARHAGDADLGIFSYGAIFAVRNAQILDFLDRHQPDLGRMDLLTVAHPNYGYIYERIWLHLFGEPFISLPRLQGSATITPPIDREPDVTVIVPVHNAEPHLAQCLDSLSRQTLCDAEFLCIDDGSDDGSAAILALYAAQDRRFRIVSQDNRGVGPARNRGMDEARGRWLAFLDADDYLPAAGTLERMLVGGESSGVDIVGGSLIEDRGTWLMDAFPAPNLGFTFPHDGVVAYRDYQFDYGFYRFLYSARLVREHGLAFPPHLRFEDPPFLTRALALAGRFLALAEPTYVYRVHPDQVVWTEDMRHGLLSGLLDNLQVAAEFDLAGLHALTWHRLIHEFRGVITEGLDDDEQSWLPELERIAAMAGTPEESESVLRLMSGHHAPRVPVHAAT